MKYSQVVVVVAVAGATLVSAAPVIKPDRTLVTRQLVDETPDDGLSRRGQTSEDYLKTRSFGEDDLLARSPHGDHHKHGHRRRHRGGPTRDVQEQNPAVSGSGTGVDGLEARQFAEETIDGDLSRRDDVVEDYLKARTYDEDEELMTRSPHGSSGQRQRHNKYGHGEPHHRRHRKRRHWHKHDRHDEHDSHREHKHKRDDDEHDHRGGWRRHGGDRGGWGDNHRDDKHGSRGHGHGGHGSKHDRGQGQKPDPASDPSMSALNGPPAAAGSPDGGPPSLGGQSPTDTSPGSFGGSSPGSPPSSFGGASPSSSPSSLGGPSPSSSPSPLGGPSPSSSASSLGAPPAGMPTSSVDLSGAGAGAAGGGAGGIGAPPSADGALGGDSGLSRRDNIPRDHLDVRSSDEDEDLLARSPGGGRHGRRSSKHRHRHGRGASSVGSRQGQTHDSFPSAPSTGVPNSSVGTAGGELVARQLDIDRLD